MGRARIASSFFVYVIVEHAGRVLLVHERKHGQLWYAPAGGLEPGESIWDAARRETLEEAGIAIDPVALLRIEQDWSPYQRDRSDALAPLSSWWRFIILARPSGTTREALTPKSVPDEHTLEARWVLPGEVGRYPLRHPDVVELLPLALAPHASR